MNWKLLNTDLKRGPVLLLGLIFLSLGIHLTRIADVGLSSWGVFHDGLAVQFSNLWFGHMTIIVGLIILLMSMSLFKTKIGLGTIINIALVGTVLNLFEAIYFDVPTSIIYQVILFALGTLFTTFGRSLYIASNLGPGPRDGLFVGLARTSQIDVKYVKPFIEFIVLIIGIVLGGAFGVGTIIQIFISGYLVQFFFKLLKFDPKNKKQNNSLFDYVSKKESLV